MQENAGILLITLDIWSKTTWVLRESAFSAFIFPENDGQNLRYIEFCAKIALSLLKTLSFFRLSFEAGVQNKSLIYIVYTSVYLPLTIAVFKGS